MFILGPKMSHLASFGYNKKFPQRIGCVSFMCLLNPNLCKNQKKSYEPILRQVFIAELIGPSDKAAGVGNLVLPLLTLNFVVNFV